MSRAVSLRWPIGAAGVVLMAWALVNVSAVYREGSTVIEWGDGFHSETTAVGVNLVPVVAGLAGLALVSYAAVKGRSRQR